MFRSALNDSLDYKFDHLRQQLSEDGCDRQGKTMLRTNRRVPFYLVVPYLLYVSMNTSANDMCDEKIRSPQPNMPARATAGDTSV